MEDIDFLLSSEFTPPPFREDPAVRFSRLQQELAQLIPTLTDDDIIDDNGNVDDNTPISQLTRRTISEKIITTTTTTNTNNYNMAATDTLSDNQVVSINIEELVTITRTNSKELDRDFLKVMEESESYLNFCLSNPTEQSPFARNQKFQSIFSQ